GIYAAESRPVAATARFEALLRAVDGVQRATPYAVKSGIVRTRDAMEGVELKGVDGSYDWSFFAGRLTEGRLPRVGDSLRTKELLLSARTARLLGVHAGDKVEMLFV
ncbi:MAG TPA: ABC transporter permease, partial [Alistipes obesi]|nr:ABC transporter permease [Alistipes communis]